MACEKVLWALVTLSSCLSPRSRREVTAVLSGSTKNYDWNSKANELEEWKSAGIGEACQSEEALEKEIEAMIASNEASKKMTEEEIRQEKSRLHCDSSIRLDCIFEVPDMKAVIMVCDCKEDFETWDAVAKECRRFAGRKQNCTEDSNCVTGAICKNEELKLREYSRWEEAVFQMNNITTPRAFSPRNVFGKIERLNINDARKRRKRILSRIVRHSYKEEIGECTCQRTVLDLNVINKSDPCIARKRPPPLFLNQAPPTHFLAYSALCILFLSAIPSVQKVLRLPTPAVPNL